MCGLLSHMGDWKQLEVEYISSCFTRGGGLVGADIDDVSIGCLDSPGESQKSEVGLVGRLCYSGTTG